MGVAKLNNSISSFSKIARSPPEIHIGPKRLTKFEKARIIGARALQISMGAPVLIEIPGNLSDPIKIAEIELKTGILPIIIRRKTVSGEYQDILLKTLLEAEKEEFGSI